MHIATNMAIGFVVFCCHYVKTLISGTSDFNALSSRVCPFFQRLFQITATFSLPLSLLFYSLSWHLLHQTYPFLLPSSQVCKVFKPTLSSQSLGISVTWTAACHSHPEFTPNTEKAAQCFSVYTQGVHQHHTLDSSFTYHLSAVRLISFTIFFSFLCSSLCSSHLFSLSALLLPRFHSPSSPSLFPLTGHTPYLYTNLPLLSFRPPA